MQGPGDSLWPDWVTCVIISYYLASIYGSSKNALRNECVMKFSCLCPWQKVPFNGGWIGIATRLIESPRLSISPLSQSCLLPQ